jgi:hypothetical protein
MALGTADVKLIEHVSAFSVLAREGIKIPTQTILKVEDSQGNILEDNTESRPKEEKVMETQIARLVTGVISDNANRAFIFGEKNPLVLVDRPVAAKTGTSNDFHDAWTMGYTPDLATGVWVGNNKNQAMKAGADGVETAAPIWHKFMSEALANTSVSSFNPPAPYITGKSILDGNLPEEVTLKIDRATGKLATSSTPENFVEDKNFKIAHSILRYIDRSDPLGEPPINPQADPQYQNWEDGIQAWLNRNPNNEIFPPKSYDDLHTEKNKPTIEIISPINGLTTNQQSIVIKTRIKAARKIDRLVCSVDGITFEVNKGPGYECLLDFNGLNKGAHTIKAQVFDDVVNSAEKSIDIFLLRDYEKNISWLRPQNNQIFSSTDFPLTASLSSYLFDLKTAKFYLINQETQEKNLICTVTEPANLSKINFDISFLDIGNYRLAAELNGADEIVTAPEVSFSVK